MQQPRPPVWVAGSKRGARSTAPPASPTAGFPRARRTPTIVAQLTDARGGHGRGDEPMMVGHIAPWLYVGTPSWDVPDDTIVGPAASVADQILADPRRREPDPGPLPSTRRRRAVRPDGRVRVRRRPGAHEGVGGDGSPRSPASASSSPASPAWWPGRWPRALAADNTVYGARPLRRSGAARGPRGAPAITHGPGRPRARRPRRGARRPRRTCSTSRWRRPTTSPATSPPTPTAPPTSWSTRVVGASTRSSTAARAACTRSTSHDHLKEDAPLGDSHRAAGIAELLDLEDRGGDDGAATPPSGSGIPTVIARLSVPYGDTFGWPFFHVMMLEHGHGDPGAHRRAVAVQPAQPRRHRRRRSPTCSRRRRRRRTS